MSRETAERWVVISAMLVAGIYAYRRLTEPAAPGKLKNIAGVGQPVPLGQFATAWGFTFLGVSILASAAPGLGGGFALLILTSDFLTNTSAVLADVGKQEKPATTTVPASPEGKANVAAPGAGSEGAAAAATSGKVGP